MGYAHSVGVSLLHQTANVTLALSGDFLPQLVLGKVSQLNSFVLPGRGLLKVAPRIGSGCGGCYLRIHASVRVVRAGIIQNCAVWNFHKRGAADKMIEKVREGFPVEILNT